MSKTVYLKYPNENVLFKLTLGKEHDLTKLSPNELKDKRIQLNKSEGSNSSPLDSSPSRSDK